MGVHTGAWGCRYTASGGTLLVAVLLLVAAGAHACLAEAQIVERIVVWAALEEVCVVH
mgnify:CR=1 FL=1